MRSFFRNWWRLLVAVALLVAAIQVFVRPSTALERAEPELAADLVNNGITLGGGGGLLRGMDVVISNATGLEVKVAPDALTCVARGTAVYLENLELLKETMESDEDQL